MKINQPKKTRIFIAKGLIFWAVVIAIYVGINFYTSMVGDVEIENDSSGFLDQLNGIIFIFGVCGIPIILFLSMVLKVAERTIDKIGKNDVS